MGDIRIEAPQVRSAQAGSQEISQATFLGRVFSNLNSIKQKFETIANLFKEKVADIKELLSRNSDHKFSAKSIVEEKVNGKGSEVLGTRLLEPIGLQRSFKSNPVYEKNQYSEFKPLEPQEKYSRPEFPDKYNKFNPNEAVNEQYSKPETQEKYIQPHQRDIYSKPEQEKYTDPVILGAPRPLNNSPLNQAVQKVSLYLSQVYNKLFEKNEAIDFHKADGQARTYVPLEILGQGNYKAALKVDKVKFALDAFGNEIKKVSTRVLLVMDSSAATQKNDIDVQAEIKVNTRLREIYKEGKRSGIDNLPHVSIAKPITYNGEVAFSSKLMNAGSLSSQITFLDAGLQDKVAEDMCKGVQELHHNGIIHRDIKADNFLIDAQGNVKIADMGKAFFEDEGAHDTATFAPTRPPGLNSVKEWNRNADIYQLGVALFQVYSGMDNVHNLRAIMAPTLTPEERKNPAKFYAARNEGVENGTWIGIENIMPPEKREFILRMLDSDPDKRPDIDEVVRFFSKE